MMQTELQVVNRFKALLSGKVPVYKIVLFGSRARGDADPDSDMDLLVIVDGDSGGTVRTEVSDAAWEASFGTGIVVVPVVFSKAEWELGPERNSLLSIAVKSDGIPL